jgi:hypothetical protein
MLFNINISTSVYSNVNININTKLCSVCVLFFLNSFNNEILFFSIKEIYISFILCIPYYTE